MRLSHRAFAAAGVVIVLAANLACVSSAEPAVAGQPPVIDPGDGGNYQPDLHPEDFVDAIDNPLLPLLPGAHWVYEGDEGDGVERTEVTVTEQRKEIIGISAVVVRDTVTLDGELVEDTFDWFAQDEDGTVWYLGEDTKEYDDGQVVSTEGSWEAGVDGAQPGIAMLADPEPGDAYRQEYDEGNAEDMAEVLRDNGRARVPFGTFDKTVVVREWTPLEPDVVEEKHYARGVGVVLEVVKRGGHGRTELVSYTAGAVAD